MPNFGALAPKGLIVGLAPAAHGANRTGRMFTGDRSGDWLFSCLHEVGLASQPTSVSRDDGLFLNRILITAVCHCAPPMNKPETDEIANCNEFLRRSIGLSSIGVYLCLGSLAWRETLAILGQKRSVKFSHGAVVELENRRKILASFHPSQQNTFTGKLTRPMLIKVLAEFADLVNSAD